VVFDRGMRQVEVVAGPVQLRQRHAAGPLHLDDAVGADEVFEVVQLDRGPLEGDRQTVVADVDDLALEHPDQLDDLAPVSGPASRVAINSSRSRDTEGSSSVMDTTG